MTLILYQSYFVNHCRIRRATKNEILLPFLPGEIAELLRLNSKLDNIQLSAHTHSRHKRETVDHISDVIQVNHACRTQTKLNSLKSRLLIFT